MYLIYGTEPYLMDMEIKKIEKELTVSKTVYSNSEDLNDILMDAQTMSMFDSKKLIIIKNHKALSKKNNYDSFIESIQRTDAVLIFYIDTEIDSNQSDLFNWLVKNANAKKFTKLTPKATIPFIKDYVSNKSGDISNSAAIALSDVLPNNARLITTEIDKLLSESQTITNEMVKVSVGNYLKNDTFAFINAIAELDATAIMMTYNKKKISGEPITTLIGQISSTLSLSLLVSAYRKQGMLNKDISDKMRIHIFRIKKAGNLLNKTSSKFIRKLIVSLADLDGEIKTGKVDPILGFESLLLKIIK
ncbi:MAG: DNA polymerase III subunit delta [Mycoplasmataceae bacterium]|nr:DNA polymerase III subunit delta [Mycoplasmataceae bacterium]